MEKTVRLEFEVKIKYDKSFFNKKFMEAFRDYMFPFETVGEHLEHLAQMKVRGLAEGFVEGYGDLDEKGIVMRCEQTNSEVLDG